MLIAFDRHVPRRAIVCFAIRGIKVRDSDGEKLKRLGTRGLFAISRPRQRCLVAIATCPALLLAFALAPFEHVHAGAGTDRGVIHAHFFEIHLPHDISDGPSFDDTDDDHAMARQLETFVPLAAANPIPCVPQLERVLPITPTVSDEPVIPVEECGHDPPAIRRFPPRPPPA